MSGKLFTRQGPLNDSGGTANQSHMASNRRFTMTPIQPSCYQIRVKIEELRNEVRQLRLDRHEKEASTLAQLATRLEELLVRRDSLTSK